MILLLLLMWQPAKSQWVGTNGLPGGAVAMAMKGTSLFAGTSTAGVFVSTDNSASWTQTGLANKDVRSLVASGVNLFAGTFSGGVYLSTDDGTHWTALSPAWTISVNALAVCGANLFAGSPGGVVLSTDGGSSWIPVNAGLTTLNVLSMVATDTRLFAGTDSGMFVSTNNGAKWTAVGGGLPQASFLKIVISGTNVFAASSDSVYLSTNNGASWLQVSSGLVHGVISSLVTYGANLFVGSQSWSIRGSSGPGRGVAVTTDEGMSWTTVNDGLSDTSVTSLVVSGAYIVAGTGSGDWRRPLIQMITSAPTSSVTMPGVFSLDQNYPNPFNPSTTIRYELPHKTAVQLSVFNTLGQQVAQLVNGELEAGDHEVKFDASGLSSGVYFYRLQAGNFVEIHKLLLMK
jgi:hypothetical protein